ncbi:nitrate reductase [candidate division GN15 bacterium]|nr:nitrate reductase [candidate division GN15 bacterium]
MMGGLEIFFYVALVVFVIGTAYKARKIATMPLHLRWDLYPIPHEKGKGEYGGSYYEEVEWWTKPANVSISSEMKEMSKEILFIQSMFHNNKPLWIFSFPFHFGLYLSIVYVVLVWLSAILMQFDFTVAADAGALGMIIYWATLGFGIAGAALGLFGAVGLLLSRVFKYELRTTSVWSDYFNLFLLAGVFATTLIAWATVDSTLAGAREFIAALITFEAAGPMPTIAVVHFVLSAAFLFWLPFTHMTHFVGKYFTYHKVRWEDHPNIQGSDLEKAVTSSLGYKIQWAAPHIKSGGSWAEAATATDDDEETKK